MEKLVSQFLERISSDMFEKHQDIIRDYVSGKQGIYALYKDEKLYYVGLAVNLKRRLHQHLKDKHKGKWDRFSVYLTQTDDHIKELETLFLRIFLPAGNAVKGKFKHAVNLRNRLKADIKKKLDSELDDLLGRKRRKKAERPSVTGNKDHATLINKPSAIRAVYKGQTYKAIMRRDGTIRYEGIIFNSLSAAGRAITGHRTCHGWNFWTYKNTSGEWLPLDSLRKNGQAKRVVKKTEKDKTPVLAGYFKRRVMLKREYKGKIYTAWVKLNGIIRMDGVKYNSPTLAAKAVVKRNVNGWKFWLFKDKDGNWVKLDTIRK